MINMEKTTLTLEFRGIEANLLNSMVKSGLFNTKSEAIRSALIKYSMDIGLIDQKVIVKAIREDLKKDKIPMKDILRGIKKVKNEGIS